MNFNKEMNVAEKAIKKSSKLLMEYYSKEKKFVVQKKNVDSSTGVISSTFTEADIGAEKIIIDDIRKNFPSHAITAEESGSSGDSDHRWLVDPLDGTSNFCFGTPLWGTMIALEFKGNTVLSAISLPVLGEFYTAQKNRGAFMNGKKISVSLSDAVSFTFGMRNYNEPRVKNYFDKVVSKFPRHFRIFGAISITGCFIATGRLHGALVLDGSPWDMAAASLLVEEAGGIVTDIKGRKWNPYQKDYVMSNGNIHNNILKLLK